MRRASELVHSAAGKSREERSQRNTDQIELPDILRDPRARRARLCMIYVLAQPGASNRQIASAAGIARSAQASRLLARLSSLGLLDKREGSPGGPNAWVVTPLGRRVTEVLASRPK